MSEDAKVVFIISVMSISLLIIFVFVFVSSFRQVMFGKKLRRLLKGHSSIEEMVKNHIHVWEDAIKNQMRTVDQHDTSYLEHELNALRDIELAIEHQLGLKEDA